MREILKERERERMKPKEKRQDRFEMARYIPKYIYQQYIVNNYI